MKALIFLILTLPLLASVVTQKITKGELYVKQSFNGTLSFNQKSRLASESDGLITALYFDEGDFVKKGSVLLKVDSKILDANIKASKALISQQNYSLERAKLDFKRYEVLLAKESVSKQKFDEFYFQKKSLEQELIALKQNLKAQMILKAKKQIKAPFTGYIANRSVEVGEWLKSGSQVALLVNTKKIDITLHLPSSYIISLKKGQIIKVTVNKKEYKAKILGLLLSGNEKTRTFPLKLRLLNTTDRFFEGMQARLTLSKSSTKNVLLVSRDAVIKRFGKDVIFIAKDKKAVMVPVQVIGYEGTKVAISAKDLKVGDEAITKGNERIRPNQEIK